MLSKKNIFGLVAIEKILGIILIIIGILITYNTYVNNKILAIGANLFYSIGTKIKFKHIIFL